MARSVNQFDFEQFVKMSTGISYDRFNDQLFLDLLAVSYVNARFGLEPNRVLDSSYLRSKDLGNIDINSTETRKLMFTLGYNFSRLGEGGYIREQTIAADEKCSSMQRAGLEFAHAGLMVSCVACAQYILLERPEFQADLDVLSKSLMYAAEQDNAGY